LGDRILVSVSVSSSATDREEEKKPAKQQEEEEEAVQRRIDSFNLASLLPYESAWLTTSSQQRQSDPKALIQDGLESLVTGGGADVGGIGGGGLVWLQLDSRYAPILGKSKGRGREYEELLHRVSAVDILAHLLGKHQSPSQASSSSDQDSSSSRILFDYTDLFL
jgi:hypothetical protein